MRFPTCGMCDQQRLRSGCAYAQSDQRLCLSLEYFLTDKLLTEYHLEFLCLTGGCTGSSESTLAKMPHCWESRSAAQLFLRTMHALVKCRILYVIACVFSCLAMITADCFTIITLLM